MEVGAVNCECCTDAMPKICYSCHQRDVDEAIAKLEEKLAALQHRCEELDVSRKEWQRQAMWARRERDATIEELRKCRDVSRN